MTPRDVLHEMIADGRALRAARNTSRHGDKIVSIGFSYSGNIGRVDILHLPAIQRMPSGEVWHDECMIPGYSSCEVFHHYWKSIEEVIAWIDANQEKAPAGLDQENRP